MVVFLIKEPAEIFVRTERRKKKTNKSIDKKENRQKENQISTEQVHKNTDKGKGGCTLREEKNNKNREYHRAGYERSKCSSDR